MPCWMLCAIDSPATAVHRSKENPRLSPGVHTTTIETHGIFRHTARSLFAGTDRNTLSIASPVLCILDCDRRSCSLPALNLRPSFFLVCPGACQVRSRFAETQRGKDPDNHHIHKKQSHQTYKNLVKTSNSDRFWLRVSDR